MKRLPTLFVFTFSLILLAGLGFVIQARGAAPASAPQATGGSAKASKSGSADDPAFIILVKGPFVVVDYADSTHILAPALRDHGPVVFGVPGYFQVIPGGSGEITGPRNSSGTTKLPWEDTATLVMRMQYLNVDPIPHAAVVLKLPKATSIQGIHAEDYPMDLKVSSHLPVPVDAPHRSYTTGVMLVYDTLDTSPSFRVSAQSNPITINTGQSDLLPAPFFTIEQDPYSLAVDTQEEASDAFERMLALVPPIQLHVEFPNLLPGDGQMGQMEASHNPPRSKNLLVAKVEEFVQNQPKAWRRLPTGNCRAPTLIVTSMN